MSDKNPDDRTESVRSAWTRTLRQEALRMRRREVSRIAYVGIVIATYADSDGTNAYPAVPTLAAITGYSAETITRAVRVLVATGLMDRKRRPNDTPKHTLLMPLGAIDWDAHLHLYTQTRQHSRRQRIKQEASMRRHAQSHPDDPANTDNPFSPMFWAAHPESNWRPVSDPAWTPPAPAPGPNPSADAVRTPFPPGVPEPVPSGETGTRSRGGFQESGTRSRTVPEPGRGRVPDPVPAGGVHSPLLPSVGDPLTDTDMPGRVPQPQVRAREDEQDDPSPPAPDLRALAGGGRKPGGQPPLLLSVPEPAPLDHAKVAAHMTALYGAPVPVRRASWTAVDIVADLDLPDPTAYVLAALNADPGRYRPATSLPGQRTPRRRAAGAP